MEPERTRHFPNWIRQPQIQSSLDQLQAIETLGYVTLALTKMLIASSAAEGEFEVLVEAL